MTGKICYKEAELAEMHTDIKYIREMLTNISEDIKLNNEFRIKGTTIYATLAVVGGTISSIAFWIIGKIWK